MTSDKDLLTISSYVKPLLEKRRTELAVLRKSPLAADDYCSCLRALEQAVAELEGLVDRYRKHEKSET
jgi:hypothetical protein